MPPQILGFCLQRRRLMHTVASVMLLLFAWLLIYPTTLAAQTASPRSSTVPPPASDEETELADMLQKIEGRLTRLRQKLAQAEDDRPDREELRTLRQRLNHLDQRARRQFDRLAQHLRARGMPTEILQRHQAMVQTYETEVATLRQHLAALDAAPAQRDQGRV